MDYAAFTESCINSIGPKASPRVKQAFPILMRKLHEFLIEADVTIDEWMQACELLIETGKVSTQSRNEMVLVSDILGVESLVDAITHAKVAKSNAGADAATLSAILGPFYRQGVPVQTNGTSIIRQDEPDGDYTHLYGQVFDHTGKPAKGAIVDIWHDAPDGLYDSQSPDKPTFHCRGRFETDAEGRYDLVCLRPCPYPIPYDHTAGQLLKMMDRHPMRPAHIHYMVALPGHKTLVTQVFDKDSKYLADDAVFAVKNDLLIDFLPYKESPNWTPPKEEQGKIKFQLSYDVHLSKAEAGSTVEIETPSGGEPVTNGINGKH